MNIPQIEYLVNQSFNSEFIEFVWQFTYNKERNQIIYKVYKDGTTFLEEKLIDKNGDDLGVGYSTSGIVSTKIIPMEELTKLKDDVILYLKSI